MAVSIHPQQLCRDECGHWEDIRRVAVPFLLQDHLCSLLDCCFPLALVKNRFPFLPLFPLAAARILLLTSCTSGSCPHHSSGPWPRSQEAAPHRHAEALLRVHSPGPPAAGACSCPLPFARPTPWTSGRMTSYHDQLPSCLHDFPEASFVESFSCP